jgi:hypothetical protein
VTPFSTHKNIKNHKILLTSLYDGTKWAENRGFFVLSAICIALGLNYDFRRAHVIRHILSLLMELILAALIFLTICYLYHYRLKRQKQVLDGLFTN